MCLTGCILGLSSTFYFKKILFVKINTCTAGIAKSDA